MQSTRFHFVGVSTLAFVTAANTLVATGCSDIPPAGGTSGTSSSSTGFGASSSSSGSAGAGGATGSSSSSSGSGGAGGSGGTTTSYDGLLMVGSTPNTTQSLYRFSMDGTMSTKLVDGAYSTAFMSANRTRFAAYYAERSVIVSDPEGGNQALVAFPKMIPYSNSPSIALSASGQYIVYALEETMPILSVYVAPTDGSAGELLFTGEKGFWKWSPKENKLVYGGIGAPLRMYDLDTKTKVDVTNTLATAYTVNRAWWSNNGERLAFVENLPNDVVAATVDKQGQDRRVLLTNLDSYVYSKWGEWSPDGQYFAMTQYVNDNILLRLVDSNGTMTRDISDDIDSVYLGPTAWSPTNHYVYVKDDASIKSVTLSGTTLDLVGPGYDGNKRLGPTGRLLYCGATLGCGSIGADGSNPITYVPASLGTEGAEMSPDGTLVVFAPKPDPAKNVPIYAASSESAETTLVTTLPNQFYTPFFEPLYGGGGVVFDGIGSAGWIIHTADGFKAIYPQSGFDTINWAHSLQ